MQLPGRLARTTVGDLLGRIYRAGASGALEIAINGPPSQRHRLQLSRGLVIGVDLDLAPPADRLGELLVREGLAPVEAVARALSKQQILGESAPKHGELLVRAGVISPEIRDAALRKQARARLESLFAATEGRDGEIRFHVGPAATSRVPTMSAPLLPRDFLHGRRRSRVTKREASSSGASTAHLHLTVDRLQAMRLLGVDPSSDSAAIRRAFRTAAARIHPDRHPNAAATERARLHIELAQLSAAYHLLCA